MIYTLALSKLICLNLQNQLECNILAVIYYTSIIKGMYYGNRNNHLR